MAHSTPKGLRTRNTEAPESSNPYKDYIPERERRLKAKGKHEALQRPSTEAETARQVENSKVITELYQAALKGPFDVPIEIKGIPDQTFWGSSIRRFSTTEESHDGEPQEFEWGDFVLSDGRIIRKAKWYWSSHCFTKAGAFIGRKSMPRTWQQRLRRPAAVYEYTVGINLERYIRANRDQWPPRDETPLAK